MATYFHGAPAEIQTDGLETLYLMNSGFFGYSDTTNHTNMVFLNSAANSLNQGNLSNPAQPSHHQQQLVGIPIQAAVSAHDPSGPPPSIHPAPDISSIPGLVPQLHYNLWAPAPANNSGGMTAHGSRRSPITRQSQQGLSLSLSPQQQTYGPYQPEPGIQGPPPVMNLASGGEVRMAGSSASWVSNFLSGLQSVLIGSKYLKMAQLLLDEVINVGKGIKDESPKAANSQTKMNREEDSMNGEESTRARVAELSTAERQELQMKKAKLVNMLDEVEQRYRQYHHHMQSVVSSFEALAGYGSAWTYTALALQTISRQFRCLRDAIYKQIEATSKSLGEEDCLAGGTKAKGGSRLRFVDHHLKQQRALQQIGMIQHNVWRPQRGLPESSVSVLRAWLFEHFLHPYPKDSDKHMLAKQTGLTRSQVSNWFINARVRLWKPMVEEMYMEETKEQEQQNNADDGNRSEVNEDSASKCSVPQENSPTRTEQTDDPKHPPIMIPSSVSSGNIQMQANFNDTDAQAGIKKARREGELAHPNTMPDFKHDEFNNGELFVKFGNGRSGTTDQGYSLISDTSNDGGSYGAYSIGGRYDPERFVPQFSGNGVSLTLGLPHSESISLSGAQQSFLSNESIPLGRRLEMSSGTSDYCSFNEEQAVNRSLDAYQSINIQTRKRISAQLLPDFVA